MKQEAVKKKKKRSLKVVNLQQDMKKEKKQRENINHESMSGLKGDITTEPSAKKGIRENTLNNLMLINAKSYRKQVHLPSSNTENTFGKIVHPFMVNSEP